MKRATSRAGMRASIAALATALALAFGAGPAVADNLHPYLVGHWNASAFEFPGFKLRIINPTSEDLLAVVVVFNHSEEPFACARVVLSQNDEAMLASQAPIWLPYGFPIIDDPEFNVPHPLLDIADPPSEDPPPEDFTFPFDSFEGVIKIVSLYAETEAATLEERVKEGLLAWILNATNVNLQVFGAVNAFAFGLPAHQSLTFGTGLIDFTALSIPYNAELHGVPRRFLTARRNAELNLIAGDLACGSEGVTFEFPEDVEPFDFFFPFTFDIFVP